MVASCFVKKKKILNIWKTSDMKREGGEACAFCMVYVFDFFSRYILYAFMHIIHPKSEGLCVVCVCPSGWAEGGGRAVYGDQH